MLMGCKDDNLSDGVANVGTDPSMTKYQSTPNLHRGYLDTDHGQVYYWTAGQGPNVVCLHQSGNSSEEYVGLIPFLADRCRLVSLDLPGHGRSSIPANELTVDDYTQVISQLLDHLNVTKAHLVGHHGGALAALNLAATQPDRVEKSILSGMGPPRSQEDTEKFIASLSGNSATIRDDPQFVTKTWERYVRMMSDGADVANIMKPFQAYLTSHLSSYRSILVNLRWDRREALNKVRGPVLLLKGAKDAFVGDQSPLLDMIPDSRLLEMQGCGTFMFYDKPQACADMITEYLELTT